MLLPLAPPWPLPLNIPTEYRKLQHRCAHFLHRLADQLTQIGLPLRQVERVGLQLLRGPSVAAVPDLFHDRHRRGKWRFLAMLATADEAQFSGHRHRVGDDDTFGVGRTQREALAGEGERNARLHQI